MCFKKGVHIFLGIFLAVAMVGCSGGGTATNEKAVQSETSGTQKVTMPEDRPAFMGKVKEIVGNEATIFKAEIDPNGEVPQGAPANQPQSQNQQPANQAGSQPANSGARGNQGGPGMSFSEEAETLLIPVGVPIVSMQRGSQEVTEVGLSQIKKDTLLRIWETNGEISFVQVMGGSATRTTRERTGNDQNSGFQRGAGGMGGMGGPPPGM
ncbi:hypothetical protein [Desulfotomaculum sp. 1211_IL3151]|uniref:hypothetical protein n=1 Tax=Desulfotomaculum sp. 1211_IL3151 TaxID=3084055 RepID=UPI002FD96878